MTATQTRPQRPAAASHPRIVYRPALDGLRGLAVAGVLLYHGGHLGGGFLGVDLFFVLSGYLITALLLEEWRVRGSIDLASFWLRRARRLLPALFAVLAAVAVLSRFATSPFQWSSIRGDGLSTLFYVANWHTIVSGASYGSDLAARSPLEHTWSVAIEEQFYLLWPLVFVAMIALRRTPKSILWAAGIITVVSTSALIGLSFAGVSQNALYLGTHTRVAAIGVGATVAAFRACWPPDRSRVVRRRIEVLGPVALILLLVTWTRIDLHDQLLYRGGLTICTLLAGTVIFSIIRPGGDSPLDKALSVKPLRALGLISYGLYLWHWPVFLLVDESSTGFSGWPLFAYRIAISIGLAIVSYTFLEQPIRRGDWGARKVLRSGAIGAAVIAMAFIISAIGAPAGRFSGAGEGPILTKTTLDGGRTPLVAIYGDSVSFVLGRDGFATEASNLGVSVLNGAILGCEPLGGITDARDGTEAPIWDGGWKDCIETMPRQVAENPQPDVAMLMFGGVAYDARIDGTWHSPCDPEYRALYAKQVGRAVDAVSAGGTPVVIVKPAPVVSEADKALHRVADNPERNECLWKALAPVLARPGVSTLDLAAYLCGDGDACDLIGSDEALRYDGVHYTPEAAAMIARWLTPQLVKAI